MPELQSTYHPAAELANFCLFPRVSGTVTVRGRMRFDLADVSEDFPPSALDIYAGRVVSVAWDETDETGAASFVATLEGSAGGSSDVVRALEALALEVEAAIGFDLVQWEPSPSAALTGGPSLPNGAVVYLGNDDEWVYYPAADRERTERLLRFAVGPVEVGPEQMVGSYGTQRFATLTRPPVEPSPAAPAPSAPAELGARIVRLTDAARVVLSDGEPVILSVDLKGGRSREAVFAETERAFAARFPAHCLWPVRWLGKSPVVWRQPNHDSLAYADVRRGPKPDLAAWRGAQGVTR